MTVLDFVVLGLDSPRRWQFHVVRSPHGSSGLAVPCGMRSTRFLSLLVPLGLKPTRFLGTIRFGCCIHGSRPIPADSTLWQSQKVRQTAFRAPNLQIVRQQILPLCHETQRRCPSAKSRLHILRGSSALVVPRSLRSTRFLSFRRSMQSEVHTAPWVSRFRTSEHVSNSTTYVTSSTNELVHLSFELMPSIKNQKEKKQTLVAARVRMLTFQMVSTPLFLVLQSYFWARKKGLAQ
jgi:hypothetical protein